MGVPRVSVVIPTLNRSRVLAQTLDLIENQTIARDQYEVIVVDNGSTDDTPHVIDEWCRKHLPFSFCARKPHRLECSKECWCTIRSGARFALH